MKAQRPIGCACVQAAAKILRRDGKDTSPGMLFATLKKLGWVVSGRADRGAVQRGFVRERYGIWGDDNRQYCRVFITRRGMDYLTDMLPAVHVVQEVALGIQPGDWGF